MRNRKTVGFITMLVGVLLVTLGSAFATHTASGGGTYFVLEGVRSQFQFSPSSLQCKVAQAGAPPGLQMFMFSTAIDSFDIDGNEVTITGQLASTTVTAGECEDGCTEVVDFIAVGTDNGTPGGGVDTFSLTVQYEDEGPQEGIFFGLGFGDPAVFGSTVVSGNVNIHQ